MNKHTVGLRALPRGVFISGVSRVLGNALMMLVGLEELIFAEASHTPGTRRHKRWKSLHLIGCFIPGVHLSSTAVVETSLQPFMLSWKRLYSLSCCHGNIFPILFGHVLLKTLHLDLRHEKDSEETIHKWFRTRPQRPDGGVHVDYIVKMPCGLRRALGAWLRVYLQGKAHFLFFIQLVHQKFNFSPVTQGKLIRYYF